MAALQLLVEACCEDDPSLQQRGLALFLKRLAEIPKPAAAPRRPKLLLGPQTAEEQQAWAAKAAAAPAPDEEAAALGATHAEREKKLRAEKLTPAEAKAAAEEQKRVMAARMPDDQVLDELCALIKPMYLRGQQAFDIGSRWKKQPVPTYLEQWRKAFERAQIHAPDLSCQVIGGRLRIGLSFRALSIPNPAGA